jgi:hypothetical protein
MRNSTSHDYYQKNMEYLCFWSGQGANGEWQTVVSIYNSPNSSSDFVVEVSGMKFRLNLMALWLRIFFKWQKSLHRLVVQPSTFKSKNPRLSTHRIL